MSNSMTDEEVFAAALRIQATPDRLAYLDQACAGNSDQRARVAGLLAALDDAGSFLNKPLADVAALGVTVGSPENGDAGPATPAPTVPLDFLSPCDIPNTLGKLGPYIVEDVIGRGGMGIVLRAIDPKLNRVVAIKVLAPELLAHPMAGKRFLREAQAAAAVSHDHVVRIYAVDDASTVPFLVMECIIGQSLQQKIERQGILEIREILRIGNQIASGLAAAHKQGLVHRDIKPANILLENGIERVKITDFGLARAVDDVGITQSGQVTGTPQYMSPEQALGEQVDHRSDLFSLGSVLYTMCTGRPAFRATSTVAVLRRVVDDTPRPIREINPETPDWLIAIIDRLMSKRPDDRYQTATEVATVLEQWLAHYQRPQTVPAPASPGVSDKVATPAVAHKGTIRRAWDEWWAGRDRWVAISAQIVLVILHCYCMIRFLNVHMSRSESDGKMAFQYYVGYPHPWYRFEINYQPQVGFTSHSSFEFLSWSIAMCVLGYALYYAVWCIEKARQPKPGWWNHPSWAMTLWGLLAAAFIGVGMKEGYSELGKKPTTSHTPQSTPAPAAGSTEAQWIALFNGKDLSGWKLHPDQKHDAWSVVDGNLVGRGGQTSHLFTERDNFKDFQLRAEVRINENGNSGIFLRTPFAMMERISGWKNPLGYEVQIVATSNPDPKLSYLSGGILPLANATQNRVRANEWFTLDVIAQGNHFITTIDGLPVLDVTDPNHLYATGHIAIQTWGQATEVSFRKIELRELTESESRTPQSVWSHPPGTITVPHLPGSKLTGKESLLELAALAAKGATPNPVVTSGNEQQVLEELRKQVDLATKELAAMQARHRTQTVTLFEVKSAEQVWNTAQLRLAEAEGNRKAAIGFARTLVQLAEEKTRVVRQRVERTVAPPAELRSSEKELSEAKLRFAELDPEGANSPVKPETPTPAAGAIPDNKQPAQSSAVLEELRKQVELTAQTMKLTEASHQAGQSTKLSLMSAERDWISARLRLAVADEGASKTVYPLARDLVRLLEDRAKLVRQQVEAGGAPTTHLNLAEKELSEARIRLLEIQPETPEPPSEPE